MIALLETVLANLKAQTTAMVNDDLEAVLKLIEEQEALSVKLQEFLSTSPKLSEAELALIQQMHATVQSNQLLAQQSLTFSRRMLRLLSGEEGYSGDGHVNTPRTVNLKVDIRA